MRKIFLGASLIVLCTSLVWAVPQILNFQGRLTEMGAPANGLQDITFRFFNAQTGGTPTFTEAHTGTNAIIISTGIFSALIGSLTSGGIPLNVFDGTDKFIEVDVSGTVLPRQRIVSVAYAVRSQSAAFADESSTSTFALRSQSGSFADYSSTATFAHQSDSAVFATKAGSLVEATTTHPIIINVTEVNVTTVSVTNLVASRGIINGSLKVGQNTIILGETSETGGAPNTIAFTGGDSFIKTQYPSAGNLTLEAGANKDIILSGAGKVGIGTTSPDNKLHVNGGMSSGHASSITGEIKLYNSTSLYATTIQGGNATVAVTYKLPVSDGTAGQMLSTDGNGQLRWIDSGTFPGPTLTSISPTAGSAFGGTNVFLYGSNFRTGATVMFGNNAATNVVFINPSNIRAVTPPATAALVHVTVRNPDGETSTVLNAFQYLIANGCADGVVDQVFTPDVMVGCDKYAPGPPLTGTQQFVDAANLCGQGWHICTMQEYQAQSSGVLPSKARWMQIQTPASWGQFLGPTRHSCQTSDPTNPMPPVAFQYGGVTTSLFNHCFMEVACGGTQISNCALISSGGNLDGAMCCF